MDPRLWRRNKTVATDDGACKEHFLFFLLDPGIPADEIDPMLCVLFGRGLEVEVFRWRKQAEDVIPPLLGIFQQSDRRQVRQVKLVPQLCLLFVLVNRERVRSVYEEDGLPDFRLLRSLLKIAALDDTVELEAAILIDGRVRVECVLVLEAGGYIWGWERDGRRRVAHGGPLVRIAGHGLDRPRLYGSHDDRVRGAASF